MIYILVKDEEKFWISQPAEITISPIDEIEKKYGRASRIQLVNFKVDKKGAIMKT